MIRRQVAPRFKDGWGESIQELREIHGYSVTDLANKLNVSKSTVSRWESEITIPGIITAIKLADLFGVEVETIFDI